jgi:hypothetical protein
MPAKRIAGMELGVPPTPTSIYKPKDAIAPSLLRDSALSGRRGISYGVGTCSLSARCAAGELARYARATSISPSLRG